MKRLALGAALAFMVAAVACGPAEPVSKALPPLATPSPQSLPSPIKPSATDAFVTKLAMAHLIDAAASRIATQRTRDASVRQFARTAIRDANEASDKLTRLARNAGIRAPSSPDAATSATIDAVRQASTRSFDARYLDAFIDTREAAIDEIERYAESGENGPLRAWSARALPALRARLQEAETLRQSVNVAPN